MRKDAALGVDGVTKEQPGQDFSDCSYGFRPKRSAHDAIRTLDGIVHRGEVSWILEADIVSFFDSLDRNELWYKWLCRRSQRKRLTWERFADLLRDFPLPRPRITVRIWGS
jgi:retron-type reverse transcriptase